MKKLSVVVAGTGQINDVEIQPGTSAGDVLHQLHLEDYLLSKGPNEPFYWRCVQPDCFTRSIGDPMPVDGRVVCHSCGGSVEFRWPNENPFWRCTVEHRHRQPLARAHLRLPKMRAIIPKAELRKLDRRFNITATALPAAADGSGQLRLGEDSSQQA